MFRLHSQTYTEVFSSLHDSVDPQSADTLHCLEQELPHGVSHVPVMRLFFHLHFRQLFGEDEDATGELDEAEKQGENGMLILMRPETCLIPDPAQEIDTLRKEALAFHAVRTALRSPSGTDAAKMVFQKVFSLLIHVAKIPNRIQQDL